MRTFDKVAFARKLPSLGTATAREDLYQCERGGKQIRVFTKGQPYKITRVEKDHLILVSNVGEEHFVLSDGWMEKFDLDITGEPKKPDMHVCSNELHVSVSIKHSSIDLSVASADNLGDAWHVSRVMVRERHRGKGFGSSMLRRMIDEIGKFGPATIIVFPGGYDSDPDAQRRFYTKNGFTDGDKPGMLVLKTGRR